MIERRIKLKDFQTRVRTDKEFISGLRGVVKKRINNFPNENPRELSDRELTRMLKNTKGFEESLKEMTTLPRREWKLEE